VGLRGEGVAGLVG